jgi:DNA-binding transcriptional ArsR family regulator
MTGQAAGLRLSARRIDGIFRALSDPTRRRVLKRLNRSPASVSELAAPAGRPVGCTARTHIISLNR